MWEADETSDEDIHLEIRDGPIVGLLGLSSAANFTLCMWCCGEGFPGCAAAAGGCHLEKGQWTVEVEAQDAVPEVLLLAC